MAVIYDRKFTCHCRKTLNSSLEQCACGLWGSLDFFLNSYIIYTFFINWYFLSYSISTFDYFRILIEEDHSIFVIWINDFKSKGKKLKHYRSNCHISCYDLEVVEEIIYEGSSELNKMKESLRQQMYLR